MNLKKTLKLITIYSFTISLITSCNSEDFTNPDNSPSQSTLKYVPNNQNNTLTREELLANGGELIYKTENKPQISAKSLTNNRLKEKLNSEHISDLGFNESNLLKLYTVNGIAPDGVNINEYATSRVVWPLLHNRYGWTAYIETRTPKVDIIKQDEYKYITVSEGWVYNESSLDDTFTKSFSYTTSKAISWNVSSTISTKIGGKIGVPLVAEGSIEISVGITAQGGETTTTSNTFQDSYTMKMPAKSKRYIKLTQKVTDKIAKYTIPVIITGSVGINYPETVDGHYFWEGLASILMNGKNKSQIGKIHVTKSAEVEVIASKVYPL